MFESAIQILLLPFWLIRNASYQTAQAFLFSWQNARLRTLWFGAPFGLTVVASIFLVLACKAAQRPAAIAAAYNDAGYEAIQRKDFNAAILFFERVLKIRSENDNDTLFLIAQAAEAQNDFERVHAILETLAPLDNAVHGPAHFWQAQRLASKGELSKVEVQQLQAHLLHAVRLSPNDREVHAALGIFYARLGRHAQAIEHLTFASASRPDLFLTLAESHGLMGNTAQAITYGRRAKDHYKEMTLLNPSNKTVRLSWADSTLFLGNFKEAVAILKEGISGDADLDLRQALARSYVTWCDSIRGDSLDSQRERLRLLQLGITAFPNDELLFSRMMELLRSNDSITGSAREFLISRIARGEAAMMSHLLLGTDAGERGDFETATKHLESAASLDPNAPIVANNLAWYLLQNEDIELERAYAMVSNLAERWPMMGAIHDTRGQLLMKMERWREAATELEKSLVQMRGSPSTHAALAQAYEKLGMQALADEHNRILTSLKKK